MHIRGEWLLSDDGVVRPVIRGEVLAGDGSWQRVLFLVDTGADRTVLSSGALAAIGRQRLVGHGRLGGLGGAADSVVVETQIRLTREAAGKVLFRGRYFAVPEPEALDMSVLGRDITGLFAVIVDRPGDLVGLLGQQHRYTITLG
jgi:hypothetical protein